MTSLWKLLSELMLWQCWIWVGCLWQCSINKVLSILHWTGNIGFSDWWRAARNTGLICIASAVQRFIWLCLWSFVWIWPELSFRLVGRLLFGWICAVKPPTFRPGWSVGWIAKRSAWFDFPHKIYLPESPLDFQLKSNPCQFGAEKLLLDFAEISVVACV